MMQPPLLITTNRGFICIDEHTPEAWLIDGGRGTYYGITYSEDKIFVAARRIAYATGKNKMDDQGYHSYGTWADSTDASWADRAIRSHPPLRL